MRTTKSLNRSLILGLAALWLVACGAQQATVERPKGRGERVVERGPGAAPTDGPQAPKGSDAQAHGEAARGGNVAGASGATNAQKQGGPYRVNLSPKAKAGERFDMAVVASLRQRFATRIDGQERAVDATVSLDVRARATVKAVNAKGQVLEARYEIQRCNATTPKGEREVLTPGTVLHVRRQGPKPRMSTDAGAISSKDAKLLKIVFSTREPTASDQDMFGTNTPRHVGESWGIDADKAAHLLQGAGAVIDAADLNGSTTLKSARPCGKTTCLQTHTQFSASPVAMKGMPPAANVLDSGMEGSALRTIPLDPRKAVATADDRFTLHVTVAVQRGDKEIEVEARIESRQRGRWTALP